MDSSERGTGHSQHGGGKARNHLKKTNHSGLTPSAGNIFKHQNYLVMILAGLKIPGANNSPEVLVQRKDAKTREAAEEDD